MQNEVDSFIETRTNAIKETVTSVKIEDVKSEGGHTKHKKKMVKKEKVEKWVCFLKYNIA